jgi:hypothetical protein
MTTLTNLNLAWKMLISMFLLVLSSGFVVAHLYLEHTTEMADGKPGLTLDDITLQFYGDRTKTQLKKVVNGSMKKFFQDEHDLKKLSKKDHDQIDAVIAWNDAGAKEEGFWNIHKHDDPDTKYIVNIFADKCSGCHGKDGKKYDDAPLDTFVDVSKFTRGDEGIDKGRLLMLSHVHLLGMGMMFLLCGAAVALTQFPMALRCILIVGGFSSIVLDILGWWTVKYGGTSYAPVVMLSGGLMALTFGASVVLAFYDLWIRKVRA